MNLKQSWAESYQPVVVLIRKDELKLRRMNVFAAELSSAWHCRRIVKEILALCQQTRAEVVNIIVHSEGEREREREIESRTTNRLSHMSQVRLAWAALVWVTTSVFVAPSMRWELWPRHHDRHPPSPLYSRLNLTVWAARAQFRLQSSSSGPAPCIVGKTYCHLSSYQVKVRLCLLRE